VFSADERIQQHPLLRSDYAHGKFVVGIRLEHALSHERPYARRQANSPDAISSLEGFLKHFPKPQLVYSDSGQHFYNDEFRSFLSARQIAFEYSPSGSSKSTGLIEMSNRVLGAVLRKSSTEWDLQLLSSADGVNDRIIQSLRYSPNEILSGVSQAPPVLIQSHRIDAEFYQSGRQHCSAVISHVAALAEVHIIPFFLCLSD
jgi:transposase InsO family protein